ncbi:dTDP-rhamnosyl transferase RfbG [Thiomicrorhabdus hydrogeniphila]
MTNLNALPSVAVLLAAYNAGNWLKEQIVSILNQKSVVVDVFISVDLSNDGTYEYCKKLEAEHENIHILNYGGRFGGAAKNFFRLIRDVDFSKYDFIALSDHDDIWLDGKLLRACEVIRLKKVDAYSSDVVAFWENGRSKLVKKSYPQKRFDYYFEAAGPGCTYVFSCQTLQKFKTFLIENWEEVNQVALHDWMIYAFCRSNDMTWHIDNLPLMKYRQHSSNQVGFNSGLKAYLKRITMVKDKWYRSEVKKITNLTNQSDKSEITLDRNFLIKHFWQLRRRTRDAYALLVMLLLGVF